MSFLSWGDPVGADDGTAIVVASHASKLAQNRQRIQTPLPEPASDPVKQSRRRHAHTSARNTPKRRGMRGLGIISPPRGTRAWWIWYATQYLPQYYNQAQIQQYVYSSPYYSQFGSPFQYGYQQPYNQYPYYQYGYNPFAQQQYLQWQGETGAALCQQYGGYWDYAQLTCTPTQQASTTNFNPTTSPPNVIGMSEGQAIQVLNSTGFSVWELSRDGISQGVPPGYSPSRVSISVANGIVNAAAVG